VEDLPVEVLMNCPDLWLEVRLNARHACRNLALLFLAVTLLAANLAVAGTPQNDKKKKKNAPATDNSNPVIALNDEQQIDYMISEVLGAWQIGDTDRMHKDYLDDVSVVNGGWAPPIIGWTNYLALYKLQRATMQQVRMDRSNTYIKVNGTTAWACFQWEFAAVINGTPSAARGQTSYVLVKRDNHWLIAHDHTSVVQSVQQPSGNTPTTEPAAPPKPAS
jgi:ketosteroid isomerase-like protein